MQHLLTLPQNNTRQEHKFFFHRSLLRPLLADLAPFVVRDVNVPADKDYYKVASVYFDNYSLRNYFDKVNGLLRRLKPRIRFYPLSNNSRFSLELKYRNGGLFTKHKVWAAETDIQNIINASYLHTSHPNGKVLAYFLRHLAVNNLMPFIRIDYARRAYFTKHTSTVRITVDSDIRCCRYRNSVTEFSPHLPAFPESLQILEIKNTGYYPHWLVNIVKKYNLKQAPISKYVASIQVLAKNSTLNL